MKFYVCKICGNIISYVKRSGVKVICCGQEMEEIIPNTVDASVEKHVPVVSTSNGKVTVKIGSVDHPMVPEHYIEWIALQTEKGNQRKELHPGQKPEVEFCIMPGDKVVNVYAYCNLHGLWKA
ncbi:MAG: desulfoferrodoxin [Clostridia bacterium]|nr:desulfoferrodoxin [Clostridia bacterium]